MTTFLSRCTFGTSAGLTAVSARTCAGQLLIGNALAVLTNLPNLATNAAASLGARWTDALAAGIACLSSRASPTGSSAAIRPANLTRTTRKAFASAVAVALTRRASARTGSVYYYYLCTTTIQGLAPVSSPVAKLTDGGGTINGRAIAARRLFFAPGGAITIWISRHRRIDALGRSITGNRRPSGTSGSRNIVANRTKNLTGKNRHYKEYEKRYNNYQN